MFFCVTARNRLRSVAFFGALYSLAVASYWVATKMRVFSFPDWRNEVHESLEESNLVADAVVFFFLFLGSLTLGCTAGRPPARLVSSADMYASAGSVPRTSTKRGALLADDVDSNSSAHAYDDGRIANDNSPRARYFAAYERIGVSDPTSTGSVLGRFFTTVGASAMLLSGAFRLRLALALKIATTESRSAAAFEITTAGFCVLYGFSALCVLFLADPGRLPPPPREVLNPEDTSFYGSHRAGAASSARQGGAAAFPGADSDGLSFLDGANGNGGGAASGRGSANSAYGARNAYGGGAQGRGENNFYGAGAVQSSYARQGNRY